jgi:hypothetical protein
MVSKCRERDHRSYFMHYAQGCIVQLSPTTHFPSIFHHSARPLPCHFMQSHLFALSLTSQLNLTHFSRLANTPMNTLAHRSLPSPSLRLASWVDARTRMLFLGAGIFALAQDREVGFIVVLLLVSLVHSSPSIFTTIPCTLYIHQRF